MDYWMSVWCRCAGAGAGTCKVPVRCLEGAGYVPVQVPVRCRSPAPDRCRKIFHSQVPDRHLQHDTGPAPDRHPCVIWVVTLHHAEKSLNQNFRSCPSRSLVKTHREFHDAWSARKGKLENCILSPFSCAKKFWLQISTKLRKIGQRVETLHK